MKIFFIAITLAFAVAPTFTSAQNQQINVFSFEDASCAAWTRSSANMALRAQYEFWIRGFESGHNYADPKRQVAIGNFPGSGALYKYLDNYCGENPNSSFVAGTIGLVEELRKPVAATKAAPSSGKRTPTPPAGSK